MSIDRRKFIRAGLGAAAMMNIAQPTFPQVKEMYGLIGKMTATPGKRDQLIAILLEGTNDMPGCLSYIIAKDSTDDDSLWITEVWDGKASHDNSLALPPVKEAIAKGRPLIAGFSNQTITTPVGGYGLPKGR